ncbi:MAG: O-antigen ligase family protein [Ruminococcaceae bacterium]|nr:O-antigen ligase family protein [Oscillospiraceae bacterium]
MIAQALEIFKCPHDITGKNTPKKRLMYDIILLVGYFAALIPGPFPSLTSLASLILIMCIGVSFFDENFYIYIGIFIYLRYRLLLGDTPVYRLYSYLVVLRFLIDIPKFKFRIVYFPALFVFCMHSIFATGRFESIRIGLNVIVDCVLAYIVLSKLLSDSRLMRKFIFVFMMGGVASGIYGWTNDEFTKAINVSGAGAQKVERNFGALSDANFAGLFYSLCIICTIVINKIPWWFKCVFLALFGIMLLETASLSALIILFVLSVLYIILKFRVKAFFILTAAFVVLAIGVIIILSVPALRNIPAISALIIRISEKLSYIPRGRWDLLTTDRYFIWQQALEVFAKKGLWGKLMGGSVVTVMVIDYSVMSIACHNSYLQSILNFGIVGTLLVYIPLFVIFGYRLMKHFTKKDGYENQDLTMLRLIFVFAFIVFGGTVDFFIDWPFMLLYFM